MPMNMSDLSFGRFPPNLNGSDEQAAVFVGLSAS